MLTQKNPTRVSFIQIFIITGANNPLRLKIYPFHLLNVTQRFSKIRLVFVCSRLTINSDVAKYFSLRGQNLTHLAKPVESCELKAEADFHDFFCSGICVEMFSIIRKSERN